MAALRTMLASAVKGPGGVAGPRRGDTPFGDQPAGQMPVDAVSSSELIATGRDAAMMLELQQLRQCRQSRRPH